MNEARTRPKAQDISAYHILCPSGRSRRSSNGPHEGVRVPFDGMIFEVPATLHSRSAEEDEAKKCGRFA